MKELLKNLIEIYGPSGSEELVSDFIREEIKDYVDEIDTDVMGNLIALKKGKKDGKRIMLSAHMDEIGVMVTHIDDEGFLRFSNIGGIAVSNSFHARVRFKNGLVGVIGTETEIGTWKDVSLAKMFIDIGASSKEEAEKQVQIGDIAVYYPVFSESNGKYMAGAMDDRAGCALLIDTIKNIGDSPNDLYFVFSSQEEVGLRGARTSAYSIDPDLAIAIDVTATGDTPKARTMAVALGKGPAIKIKDSSIISHPKVKNWMIETAEENDIPYQLEVLEFGGTDSGAIHLSRAGVPSGVLSIPCRYVHSDSETIDAMDLENGSKLLTKLLESKVDI